MLSRRGEKIVVTENKKQDMLAHKKKYGKGREPLLNGLTTEYDLQLFREAQARASENEVSIQESSK